MRVTADVRKPEARAGVLRHPALQPGQPRESANLTSSAGGKSAREKRPPHDFPAQTPVVSTWPSERWRAESDGRDHPLPTDTSFRLLAEGQGSIKMRQTCSSSHLPKLLGH